MKDFRGYNLDTYYTQYLVHSHGQTIKFKLHYLLLRYYQIDIDDIDIKAIQCRCRQIIVDIGNYLKRPIIKQVLVCLTKSIVAATLLYLRIRIVFHVCPALCTTHTVQTSTSKYFPRQERLNRVIFQARSEGFSTFITFGRIYSNKTNFQNFSSS